MLLKLGFKNLKHNLLMNILTILQMTVAFVILISIISTIVSRFTYYSPISRYLNKKGSLYNIVYAINPETGVTLRTTDEIHDLLEYDCEISAQYDVFLNYDNQDNEVEKVVFDHFISYDDNFAEIYTPELESGKWFNLNREPNDIVPVVVSQNNYGFNVGDIIPLGLDGVGFNAEIIGILKDDTKIIDTSLQAHEKIDYRNFYRNYKFDREERTTFIMLQKDLIDKPVIMQLNGNVFVTYPDDTPDSQIEANDMIIQSLHSAYTEKTDIIKKNSFEHIFSQIYNLIPIFICIFILTMVGAISTSALSAKQQLRNYAVYYICGLKWKQCAVVNCLSSLICVIISFLISIFTTIILKTSEILGETVIDVGLWELLGCFAIIIIYVALSIILPINIIGSNTPNQVLKSN